MKIANKLDIVQFSDELIDDFVVLFNRGLGIGRGIDRNKALNIFGKGPFIGYLAFDNKSPVGFYGLVKSDFIFNNELIHIGQSVNTIVLPEYRKYNLFFHLSELTNSLAQREKIQFIYGFPNNPDLIHSILDWTYLEPMKKYSFYIKTIPIAKVFWKMFTIRRVYLLYYKLVTGGFRKNEYQLSNLKKNTDNNFYIPRSKDYIYYKKQLGAYVFKINNIELIIGFDYRMKIGDIEDVSFEEFNLIIKKLRKLCFFLGITEICFCVDGHSDWIRILGKKYVPKNEAQLMYYPLNENYKLEFAHISMLDYDTF